MTRIEEQKVTTTYEEVDPPKQHVDNINLNVNTKTDETDETTETVTVEETTEETQPTVNVNVSR